MDKPPVIVWFRRDLRLHDHPALTAAAASGHPVLPVFTRPEMLGAASAWWLHHSLIALDKALVQYRSRLLFLDGPPARALASIVRQTGASAIFFNRSYEPEEIAAERAVSRVMASKISLNRCGGDLLYEPETLRNTSGQPFRMFTPFWRACRQLVPPPAPLPPPRPWPRAPRVAGGVALGAWGLCPRQPDWAANWRTYWQPGERGAQLALERFVQQCLADYATQRDRPDREGTSSLSPHLHFGEISPRYVWHAVQALTASDSTRMNGADAFLRQLGWREFALHVLHANPELSAKPLQASFNAFPWRRDPPQLRAWQRGQTGYPLVDAGMRQLWSSGWMHNRVRMVAASFLVKHLLLDWREGAAWFMDTLVDADIANNTFGWQWVAGCGTDAAPFFRIFNPVEQGRRFDPDGAYVRRWVPELSKLPARWVHAPWTAPEPVLTAAGVVLDRHYPLPIADHAAARARALAAYAEVRNSRQRP